MNFIRTTVAALAVCFTLGCAVAQMPPPIPQPAPVTTTAPSTQITTTAPVTSDTTISIGTIAGQVLTWLAVAFSVPVGGLAVKIMMQVMNKLGIQTTDLMKAQLQATIVNGLNAAAASTAERTKGQGQIAIKNAIVLDTVRYTQEHAAETITALGLDPTSGEAVQAIKARIETAITDPLTPTPAVLTPNPTAVPA